jgi:hypothetical protein
MPKFVIEREIPNIGRLNPTDLRSASARSCHVLQDLGPDVQWLESYVTDDRLYCVFIAPDEESVREHARQGGLPANRISQVRSIMRPLSGETPRRQLQ